MFVNPIQLSPNLSLKLGLVIETKQFFQHGFKVFTKNVIRV